MQRGDSEGECQSRQIFRPAVKRMGERQAKTGAGRGQPLPALPSSPVGLVIRDGDAVPAGGGHIQLQQVGIRRVDLVENLELVH